MTTRHAGYLVVLDSDLREDDAAATVAALGQIKGVISVEPVTSTPEVAIARARVRLELMQRLWGVLDPGKP